MQVQLNPNLAQLRARECTKRLKTEHVDFIANEVMLYVNFIQLY